jgi:hypothetical protein
VAGVGFSDGDKGDITISSSGTVLTIDNDAVTYAKIQNVSATDRLLGRSSAGAGDVEEITCTSFGRSLIDDADAATARTTLSVQPTAGPSFTAGITVTQAMASPTVVLRNTAADATDKAAQVVGAHYTATEETVQGIGIYSTATENLVAIGGGSALSNAASEVRLYTAANATTTTGTIRLTISSTGTATFSGQIVGQAGAAITGAATFANTGDVVPLTVTNAGTANSFVVNDASGDTTPFVIDASGRVGIGTGSPGAELEVADSSSDNDVRINLRPNGSTLSQVGASSTTTFIDSVGARSITFLTDANTRLTISSTGTATFAGQVLVTAGSGSSGSYKPGVAISGDDDTGIHQVSGNANTLSIVTNGTERVRVDASGNVGIGCTPAGLLDLGSAVGVKIFTYKNSAANAGIGTDLSSAAYECSIFAGGTADTHGRISFGRRRVDTGTYTERMSIDSAGTVVAPQVYADTVGATNRDLFVDSTGKLGYVSSIRESKTDIVTLDDVSWLSALSPVSYRYRKRNPDGTYSDEADGVTDYGLIAEDVEAVKPELCFYDDVDGEPQLRGVTYSKLITPMLRYIQQLEARIAALEEQLNG